MSSSEPTDNAQPDGLRVIYGKARMVSIGAGVNITLSSYVTRITAYTNPVDLNLGSIVDHGKVKKIYNDAGETIVINSSITVQGGATDTITLTSGGFIELVYLNDPDITERFREVDGVNYSLS